MRNCLKEIIKSILHFLFIVRWYWYGTRCWTWPGRDKSLLYWHTSWNKKSVCICICIFFGINYWLLKITLKQKKTDYLISLVWLLRKASGLRGNWRHIEYNCAKWSTYYIHFQLLMMTSSNGNISRVTGPLCENSPANSPRKGQWRGALVFDLRLNKPLCKQTKRRWFETHRAHYDVTVMIFHCCDRWQILLIQMLLRLILMALIDNRSSLIW